LSVSTFLLFFILLAAPFCEALSGQLAASSRVQRSMLNGSHPPLTPVSPQGSMQSALGKGYASCSTGNSLGSYSLPVIADDSFDIKGTRLLPANVGVLGPYLTFGKITGGLGLTVTIENIGETDANNVSIDVNVTKGFFVKFLPRHYDILRLAVGNSTRIHVPLWGVGLGLLRDLPTVTLTVSAPDAETRGKQVIVRVLGPIVKTVGESWVADESYNGYTLYSPMMSMTTFLIDNNGTVSHTWNSSYKPALAVYLLENGDILRTALAHLNSRFWGGGIGGCVEMIDWNGTPVWWFNYTTDQHCLHHDVKMLPNGNILMIAWEYKSGEEAIAMGRNPDTLPMGMLWPDHLIEVKPLGRSGGVIVWEWHLWDHLIQDFDSSKKNYGVVWDHPELVDINYGGKILADWTHINSVDYNAQYDQILLSVLEFNEILVIDHSTTTEEAAGHNGGRYGKGGDLLYRWGNPQVYRMGDASDQKLFNQHDAEWIKPGLPGAGNILIFNNGHGKPGAQYSSVDEIVSPVDGNGFYAREPGSPFGPEAPQWNYTASVPTDFYAINLGSAQRLPNGNTLICDGPHGRFFEVTEKKEVVWEFTNQVPDPLYSHVFKIQRYGPQYPGLKFH